MSRIIAGSAKGRRIDMPRGEHTRPTTDRVREALFSALASWFGTAQHSAAEQLAGISVLDLFAGSGAVGLEAASRGASPVVMVEADRPTARIIEHNTTATGLRAAVRHAKAEAVAVAPGNAFDLVFLDPPYGLATEEVEGILTDLAAAGLAERGLVVVERSSRDRPPQWPAAFGQDWVKRYGETVLYFGALGEAPADGED